MALLDKGQHGLGDEQWSDDIHLVHKFNVARRPENCTAEHKAELLLALLMCNQVISKDHSGSGMHIWLHTVDPV